MKRVLYNPVTIPLLIPCDTELTDGLAIFIRGRKRNTAVRPFTDDDARPNTAIGAHNWNQIPEAQRIEFRAAISFLQALKRKDLRAADKAYGGLHKLACVKEQAMKEALQRPAQKLAPIDESYMSVLFEEMSFLVGERIESVTPVLWYRAGDTIRPALYCPTMLSAFYLRALLASAGGEAIRVCPKCGNPFLQAQPNQDYCSIRCREAYRVARWRENNPEKDSPKARGEKSAHRSKRRKR